MVNSYIHHQRSLGLRRRDSEQGLWHQPPALNLISDILLLLIALAVGYVSVSWFLSRPLFVLHSLVLTTTPKQVTHEQIEYVARTTTSNNNFFLIDVQNVRDAFEKLPWVRNAQVRRRWPGLLEVHIEEHELAAYWVNTDSDNAVELINRQGETFTAASNVELPQLFGPAGSAASLWQHYGIFSAILAPLRRHIVELDLSPRQAWKIKLDDGMVMVLGRDQDKLSVNTRLERFVRTWPQITHPETLISAVDLRYRSGFTITVDNTPHTVKGSLL